MSSKLREEKLHELAVLEKKVKLKEGLPHLYGMPLYAWAYSFYISTNRYNLLCAANQISKSSTQIRKAIHWATAVELWPKLWKRRPTQFWYLYPSKTVATTEFRDKWVKEFLPKEEFKDHAIFGWREEIKNKEIHAVHFNSGVSIYFKTYAQDVQDLQSGSVHAIFCDEELPYNLYPELNMRISATWGYFHMVFTATLGQEEWRRAIEEKGQHETFKDAFKIQVSMYDCLTYMDGSKSHWTPEKIQQVINSCGTEAEVLRRVFGRFIKSEGLKYPSFNRSRNYKPGGQLPADWFIYAGIDSGSGGEDNHPAAIVFVAVSDDFKRGRVFMGWRGDDVTITTSSDILLKYEELRASRFIVQTCYDHADKDMETISLRMGIPLEKADKGHERGEKILNVLFKNAILTIDECDELEGLVQELQSLLMKTHKTKAKDDFIDALRYAVTLIPWDWSVIQGVDLETPSLETASKELPNPRDYKEPENDVFGVEEELASWGELHEL